MYDIIILGGGPAGLTAAIYAIHKRLNVLLVSPDLGGKTNYRLQLPFVERHTIINGDEIISRFSREIEYLEDFRRMDKVDHVETIHGGFMVRLRSGEAIQGRSLIVATGANPQLLDVPGEREFMMRGLCYSAVSYAQLFIDRDTVVIGSNKLALRSVAELARVAQSVTLIAENLDAMDTPLGRKVRALNNVRLLVGYEILRIQGDQYARSAELQGPDGSMTVEADAFFVEQDLLPRSGIVAHLVELDDRGRIKINARNETSAPGIYAAGDVTDSFAEQVLIAVGEGAKAALSATEYLLRLEDETPVIAL